MKEGIHSIGFINGSPCMKTLKAYWLHGWISEMLSFLLWFGWSMQCFSRGACSRCLTVFFNRFLIQSWCQVIVVFSFVFCFFVFYSKQSQQCIFRWRSQNFYQSKHSAEVMQLIGVLLKEKGAFRMVVTFLVFFVLVLLVMFLVVSFCFVVLLFLWVELE